MRLIGFIQLIKKTCVRVKSKQKYQKLVVLLPAFIICVSLIFFGCKIDTEDQTMVTSETESSVAHSTGSIERMFEECKNRSYMNVLFGESNVVIFRDGQTITVEGSGRPEYANFVIEDYATDHDAVAFLLDVEDGVGQLYFSDGTTCEKVSDNVARFHISDDGSAIIYLKNITEAGIGTLCVYQSASKESAVVSDNAGYQFAISPLGRSIAYMYFPELQDISRWEAHRIVFNEESVILGEHLYPVTLTDDGSLVYAISVEIDTDGEVSRNEFGVFHLFDEEFRHTILSTSMLDTYLTKNLIFNADRTRVLYCDNAGIKFSELGKDAVLLELNRLLHGGLSCKKNVYSLSDHFPYVESIELVLHYTNTNQLNNVLMCIGDQSEHLSNLWYFTEDFESVILTKGLGRFQMTEEAVLINSRIDDQRTLVYLADVYSSRYEMQYEPSDELHIDVASTVDFVLTSDKNIYYISDSQEHDMHYELYTFSRIFYDSDHSSSEIVLSDCVSIDRYVRNGEPDIVYFLRIREPASDSNTDQYLSAFYYDLYIMEDRKGSVPELLAEKVGWVESGDYGIYYVQLEQVCPNFSGNSIGEDNEQGYNDKTKIFYSTDGVNFDDVAEMENRRWWRG